MTWKEVGRTFLEFFQERGHTVVSSAPLVPAGDPTLLFTNAGMVPFKNVFLGLEHRPYTRAASIQKCLRVSGHHNDLETVGPSRRHHTFFQMCGNFSFGAYFKREAIRYAWDLVTGSYKIPPEKLYFTVYKEDDEAFEAWRDLGIPAERIYRLGEKTNFWMMGPVGPVGPNSELHYDWGPEHCTCRRADCSVGLDNDCDRWLEIWNLVFMQYDQAPDGTRRPLERPGVDTGMGLERMTAVLQGKVSNYDTDMFAPIMEHIQTLMRHDARQREQEVVAYRVIADHSRAAAFLIADGIMPGNEGRSYVLRMIIRRAIRFGKRAGLERPFLYDVCDTVVQTMSDVYLELSQRREFIRRVILAEEERFGQTLAAGLARLDEAITDLRKRGAVEVPGDAAFRLYDTFGFPIEMTQDIAREQGLTVDEEGFARAMEEQRARARAAGGFQEGEVRDREALTGLPATEFLGYLKLEARTTILALLRGGERVEEVQEGDPIEVVLDRTPFYAEAGGQVGDRGRIIARRGEIEVTDTQRSPEGVTLHIGRVARGRVRAGDKARAVVDGARRHDIMRNHTATHLLHRALHEIVGEHARQAGSLVAPDRLRFDFTHLAALSEDEHTAVEERVNEQIFAGLAVRARWMSYDDAVRLGAMALFGEKYGDRVRVVEVNEYSRELCGGTHVEKTSEIGLFKIVAEGSAAAGIRRIEAVTGRGAYAYLRQQEDTVREIAAQLKVSPAEVPVRVRRMGEQLRDLERMLETLQTVRSGQNLERLLGEAKEIDGTRLIISRLDGLTHDALRRVGDQLRERLPSGVFVLGGAANGKVNLVAMVTRDLVGRGLRADAFIKDVAAKMGGSGGGREDLAQAGGREVQRLDAVLAGIPELVKRMLAHSK